MFGISRAFLWTCRRSSSRPPPRTPLSLLGRGLVATTTTTMDVPYHLVQHPKLPPPAIMEGPLPSSYVGWASPRRSYSSSGNTTTATEKGDVSKLRPLVRNVLPKLSSPPKVHLSVIYPSGAEVGYGNTLTPSQVIDKPTVTLVDADLHGLYTLIMTDPDAPSRDMPLFREYVHWVVVNIPGGEVDKGTTVADYVGAGPPFNSGPHGYLFLLYKQPHELSSTEVQEAVTYFSPRGGLKAAQWVRDHLLAGEEQEPAGVVAFEAAWDDSVDALHSKQGFMPPEQYRSPQQVASLKDEGGI